MLGSPLSLHCRASGRPQPRLSWLREGQLLRTPHSLFTVRETPEGSFLETAAATQVTGRGQRGLDGCVQKVFGSYSCLAKNLEGSVEVKFSVVREEVILVSRAPPDR